MPAHLFRKLVILSSIPRVLAEKNDLEGGMEAMAA